MLGQFTDCQQGRVRCVCQQVTLRASACSHCYYLKVLVDDIEAGFGDLQLWYNTLRVSGGRWC